MSANGGWEVVHIPRGTFHMTLLHKGFDETRRLGLRRDTEQFVRQASSVDETGMLIMDSVVPGGPTKQSFRAKGYTCTCEWRGCNSILDF